jgi:2'-5' RNA ligase
MAGAVVAFPSLADADRRLIEDIRREHDPNAARIAAHFTLVFPSPDIPAAALLEDAAAVARETPPIAFVLRRLIVHNRAPDAYVFLVPDEGHESMMRLHGRLKARAPEGKGEAFVPHLTVARLPSRDAAKTLATRLAERRLAIAGRVETLSVVEVESEGPVRTVGSFPLGARQ